MHKVLAVKVGKGGGKVAQQREGHVNRQRTLVLVDEVPQAVTLAVLRDLARAQAASSSGDADRQRAAAAATHHEDVLLAVDPAQALRQSRMPETRKCGDALLEQLRTKAMTGDQQTRARFRTLASARVAARLNCLMSTG